MKILKEGMWKRPIEAADLLERKGCDHFTLLENDVQISGRFYELWWYSYQDENHILAKGKQYPYFLHFFLLEAGDAFEANDFTTYIKTGELKAQQPNFFEEII